MKTLQISLVFLSLCFLKGSLAEDFPDDIKRCHKGDTNCIQETINFILKNRRNGYKKLNLVPLSPLLVSSINIKQGKESPVNIDLKFRNSKLMSFSESEATQVKGFGEDIKGPHELTFEAKSITLLSDYDISGRVLILPINGNGKSNLTTTDVQFKMIIYGEPVEKNGKTHMKIRKLDLDLETSRLYMDLTNLFNGDKVLGENMNLFLNENWKDIFGELKGSMLNAFGMIFEAVINNVLEKFPYEELFAKDM